MGPESKPIAARVSLAILFDPDDPFKPSWAGTLDHFAKIAARLGVRVQRIGPRDIERVAEHDALFIRTLTGPDLPAFRFAQRAESLGNPDVHVDYEDRAEGDRVYDEELVSWFVSRVDGERKEPAPPGDPTTPAQPPIGRPPRRRRGRDYRAWEVVGLEVEYTLVDGDLEPMHAAEAALGALAGRATSEVELRDPRRAPPAPRRAGVPRARRRDPHPRHPLRAHPRQARRPRGRRPAGRDEVRLRRALRMPRREPALVRPLMRTSCATRCAEAACESAPARPGARHVDC